MRRRYPAVDEVPQTVTEMMMKLVKTPKIINNWINNYEGY